MSFFTTTQAALAAGRSVFFGELYKVDFTSGTEYYWDGFGDLPAYGQTWLGRAGLVARSDIPIGVDDEQGVLTLTMSGVDADIVARVRAEEAEIFGRTITIWGQFFDESLQISDDHFQLFRGRMDVPTYGAVGPTSRTITIPCEGEWDDRNDARFSYFSGHDQLGRYPGDRGCEYVYRYTPGVRRQWPKFS